MKFGFTATIALLLMANLTGAERQVDRNKRDSSSGNNDKQQMQDILDKMRDDDDPKAHGNTRYNDSPMQEGDEDWQKERKVYSNNEKELWIYGTPGTDDYRSDLTEDEIAEMEIMWEYDYAFTITRGVLQGLARGFYKDYRYQIKPECFGKQGVMYMYYIVEGFSSLDADAIIQAITLLYNVWYMFEYECELLDHLYDVSQFCFDHDCNPEQLLQNEMKHVFQVTGALNAMAAIYYDTMPEADQHTGWFDMYSEVGLNIGKLIRYTLAFDPKEVHDN